MQKEFNLIFLLPEKTLLICQIVFIIQLTPQSSLTMYLTPLYAANTHSRECSEFLLIIVSLLLVLILYIKESLNFRKVVPASLWKGRIFLSVPQGEFYIRYGFYISISTFLPYWWNLAWHKIFAFGTLPMALELHTRFAWLGLAWLWNCTPALLPLRAVPFRAVPFHIVPRQKKFYARYIYCDLVYNHYWSRYYYLTYYIWRCY